MPKNKPAQTLDHLAPDGHMTLAAFARSLNVHPSGLRRSLKRHGFYLKRKGKLRLVSIDQAERYVRVSERRFERVNTRPKGWLTTVQAADATGCSGATLWRAAIAGYIRAANYKARQYYHPDDLEHFKYSINNIPTDGWYCVAEFAKEHGTRFDTAKKWLKRHGFETRKFRVKAGLRVYARADALCAWLSSYQAWCLENRDKVTGISSSILKVVERSQNPLAFTELCKRVPHNSQKSLQVTANRLARQGYITRFKHDGKTVYAARAANERAA
jgi:hypothetical protein